MSIADHKVLEVLSRHIGKSCGISAERLVIECTGQEAEQHELRQLRTVVKRLRLDGYHICAHPRDGYFMASNADELDATCEFLYDRALSSLQQISRMKKIALPDIRGQLRLPT